MVGIGTGIPALPLVASTEAERRAIATVLGRHGIGATERMGARVTPSGARVGA
jgi:L,D-peptidoglycan transpeptidase YkuD (ErfK/YbiS/YcfS/YnhG family)